MILDDLRNIRLDDEELEEGVIPPAEEDEEEKDKETDEEELEADLG